MAIRWLSGKYWRLLVPFGFGLAVTLLARLPVERLNSLPDLCLIKAVSGWACPGCGIIHAAGALLHADFSAAADYNWRIFLVAPLMLWVLWRSIISLPFRNSGIPA